MRLLNNISLEPLFIIVLLATWLYALWPSDFITDKAAATRIDMARSSLSDIINHLPRGEILNFKMLNLTDNLRIAFNAEYADLDMQSIHNRQTYSVEVLAYDQWGKIIEKKIINDFFIAEFFYENKWGLYNPSFFLTEKRTLSNSNLIILNFKDKHLIANISVRRLDDNINLAKLYVRVFQPANLSPSQKIAYWLHLTPQNKEQLLAANIYPSLLMQKEEYSNLLSNLWVTVPALGLPGRDYESRTMYTVKEKKGVRYGTDFIDYSQYVDRFHSLVIPLRDVKNKITIKATPIDFFFPEFSKLWWLTPPISTLAYLERINNRHKTPFDRFNISDTLQITWRGAGLGQTEEYEEKIDKLNWKKTYEFKPGFITVSTNSSIKLDFFNEKSNYDDMLVPLIGTLRVFSLDPQIPLEYSIFHNPYDDVIVSIQLRKLTTQPFTQTIPQIDKAYYELLNYDGKVITKGVIPIERDKTTLDFSTTPRNLYISEKETRVFHLSKDVAKLRLTGATDIAAVVFDRLSTTKRKYIAPDDDIIPNADGQSIRRGWFTKLPDRADSLELMQRSLLIKSQARAISEDQLTKIGAYQWQTLFPKRLVAGADILEQKDPHLPVRPQMVAALFSLLPIDEEVNLNFLGITGMKNIKPTIIIWGENGMDIAVKIDGEQVYTAKMQTDSESLELPSMPVGNHKIFVKAPSGASAYINYTTGDDNSHVQHYVAKLDNTPQTYEFTKEGQQTNILNQNKQEDSTLSIRAYALDKQPRTVTAKVNCNYHINTPTRSGTIAHWEYLLHFHQEPEAPHFVEKPHIPIFSTSPLFIKLGADCPKGIGSITMSSDRELYIRSFILSSGLVDNREINMEEDIND